MKRHLERNKSWFYRRFYGEDVSWDTLKIGRLSIHLCGPWDYGAPLRLHLNWFRCGYRCSYCGDDWLDGGGCSRPCEPGSNYNLRPVWGRTGWHFAIGLWPGHGFAKRLYEGEGGRWWYVSTPRIEAKHRELYARWKKDHPSD